MPPSLPTFALRAAIERGASEAYRMGRGEGRDLCSRPKPPLGGRLVRFILARRGRAASRHVE